MDIHHTDTLTKREILHAYHSDQTVSANLEALDLAVTAEELSDVFDRLHAHSNSRKMQLKGAESSLPIDTYVSAVAAIRGQASMMETFLIREDVKSQAVHMEDMRENLGDLRSKFNNVSDFFYSEPHVVTNSVNATKDVHLEDVKSQVQDLREDFRNCCAGILRRQQSLEEKMHDQQMQITSMLHNVRIGEPAPAPTEGQVTPEKYREWIHEIYSFHDPDKVMVDENFLKDYAGKERLLYLNLCRKHGIVPRDR